MTTITIAQWIITKLELHCYRGNWYLLRVKFRNDSNFLVGEIGRGRGVEERSLERSVLFSVSVNKLSDLHLHCFSAYWLAILSLFVYYNFKRL